MKPNAPENVTVRVEEKEHGASLHVDWGRLPNTDTESGWVTVRYQVRVKQRENQQQWKVSGKSFDPRPTLDSASSLQRIYRSY